MKTFTGICYDGPYEGRRLEHYWSQFPVAAHCRDGLRLFEPGDNVPTTVKLSFYRWSHPLRKWVFVP